MQKDRHWNFKHAPVLHNIFKWFTVIVVNDLRNDFEINAALE